MAVVHWLKVRPAVRLCHRRPFRRSRVGPQVVASLAASHSCPSPCRAAGLAFILEPRVRYAGQPGEQATMFLLDLGGNALEFKSLKHPEHVFTA
jgi:extradiol dioxygenase family protein